MSQAADPAAAEDGSGPAPTGSRPAGGGRTGRALAAHAGAVAIVLGFTQLVLDPSRGPGRGTPTAVLFQGLVAGALTAMTAAGLVLVYRSLRILNFAAAALGAAGAIFATGMVAYVPAFPFVLTFLVALGLGALSGAAVDLAFGRRFASSPRLVLTVVTIVGSVLLFVYSAMFVLQAPWFPGEDEVDPNSDLNPGRLRRLMPFAGFEFEVGSLPLRFGFPEVLALEVAVVALVGLGLALRFTRIGTAMRAAAENSERAALLGISTGAIGTIVWAIAGALSAATSTLNALTGNPGGYSAASVAFLLPPVAAAVVARFRNLPTAVVASVLIGVVSSALRYAAPGRAAVYIAVGLFAMVVGGLLLQRRQLFRLESQAASSWQATDEPRPIPAELLAVNGVRVARAALVVALLAVALGFPFLAPVRHQVLAGDIFILGIVALSLVVLTGWAGQVSLGQFALVGVGAVLAGHLASEGPGFWFAIPVATALTGAFALVMGLPALRIRGLFLAGVTFAFAVAVEAFLASPDFGRRIAEVNLTRPSLLFVDFDDERSMYFLCMASLVAAVLVVVNLRRSRFGRVLIALRENEANVQAFGIRASRMKLYAFALSGVLCGFAGSLLEVKTRGADAGLFSAAESINVFVFTIIGGVASPAGALLGAAYFGILNNFFAANRFVEFLAPMVPLVLLYIRPGGLLSLLLQVRDAGLRIVAQRRQLVVPSLFADYDAEALERRLIPIGEPSMTDGLAVLPPDQRYALASELYHGGERLQGIGPGPGSAERLAIEAAADAGGDGPVLAGTRPEADR